MTTVQDLRKYSTILLENDGSLDSIVDQVLAQYISTYRKQPIVWHSWPALDDDSLSGIISDVLGDNYSVERYHMVHQEIKKQFKIVG